MSISKVPLEVVGIVLEHLDSPQSLASAIISSPVFYQAFIASRSQVPISIFQRSILPGARKDALAILKCSSVSTENQLGDLWEFLDTHLDHDKTTFPFPRDNAAITILMKLITRVLRLERDYFNDTMFNLADAPNGDASEHKLLDSPTPLSDTERTRIQRAFLRLELYSRCFLIGEDDIGIQVSVASAELQFDRFVHRLQPWEVEEMVCIHQYLSFRVGTLIEQVQNEIVAIAFRHQAQGPSAKSSNGKVRMSMMDKLLPYPSSKPAIPSIDSAKLPEDQTYDPDDFSTFAYWRGSPIFTMDGRREFYEFLSSLVSRGLEYLVSVFDADQESQRHLLLSGQYITREFLPEAINYAIENDIESDPPTDGSLTQEQSTPPVSRTENFVDDPSHEGFMDIEVERRIFYSFDHCWEERERFDFREKGSAQGVLMQVEIPDNVMDDLNRTYGFWDRTSVKEEKQPLRE
ncbi:unnamed protein product [Clonostachys rosea]|uniref:F-box domain-containing protein n=1 Tax=Bionectria ochroleuca TaxID=29856 RepID=A0ABY6TXY7_BIOOC|nr:unnamed protein product [Clonostachys rosea]